MWSVIQPNADIELVKQHVHYIVSANLPSATPFLGLEPQLDNTHHRSFHILKMRLREFVKDLVAGNVFQLPVFDAPNEEVELREADRRSMNTQLVFNTRVSDSLVFVDDILTLARPSLE